MSLIVDFPSGRISPEKAVQFAPTSALRFYEPGKEVSTYSAKEYRAMRRARAEAVKDVRRVLANPGQHAKVDLTDLTGIENMLDQKIMTKVIAAKKEARQAVIDEQARQDRMGEYNPDRIAMVSKRITLRSQERAQKIGLLHAR